MVRVKAHRSQMWPAAHKSTRQVSAATLSGMVTTTCVPQYWLSRKASGTAAVAGDGGAAGQRLVLGLEAGRRTCAMSRERRVQWPVDHSPGIKACSMSRTPAPQERSLGAGTCARGRADTARTQRA